MNKREKESSPPPTYVPLKGDTIMKPIVRPVETDDDFGEHTKEAITTGILRLPFNQNEAQLKAWLVLGKWGPHLLSASWN